MATFGDSYSRMVAWLKIILPLCALAILSTLFLMSRSVDPTLSIGFSDTDLSDLTDGPRIEMPAFSGVTDNGAAIRLSAEVALPLANEPDGFMVRGIDATFESPGGQEVDIVAGSGTLNSTDQMANLSGGVKLETSLGYTIVTDTIKADFATSGIETTGPIVASGPLGTISAGMMILQIESAANRDAFELVFRDGVKLVYDPTKDRE